MRRGNRRTGTVITLYHSEQAGLDSTQGEWAVVCEDHKVTQYHPTLMHARMVQSDPSEWCEQCLAAVKGGNVQPRRVSARA